DQTRAILYLALFFVSVSFVYLLLGAQYIFRHITPHIGEPLPAYDDLMIHPPELMYKMLYYYHDAKKPKKGRERNVVPFFSDLRS
ncbi:MAG: NADH-quinone oxidoreductase subunit J, partial [Candidatus Hodarchaeales archaeon]